MPGFKITESVSKENPLPLYESGSFKDFKNEANKRTFLKLLPIIKSLFSLGITISISLGILTKKQCT